MMPGWMSRSSAIAPMRSIARCAYGVSPAKNRLRGAPSARSLGLPVRAFSSGAPVRKVPYWAVSCGSIRGEYERWCSYTVVNHLDRCHDEPMSDSPAPVAHVTGASFSPQMARSRSVSPDRATPFTSGSPTRSSHIRVGLVSNRGSWVRRR